MFERLWVRIPAPYTGWAFFTLICCKNCSACLKRPKINEKEARVGPFFKKYFLNESTVQGPDHFQSRDRCLSFRDQKRSILPREMAPPVWRRFFGELETADKTVFDGCSLWPEIGSLDWVSYQMQFGPWFSNNPISMYCQGSFDLSVS